MDLLCQLENSSLYEVVIVVWVTCDIPANRTVCRFLATILNLDVISVGRSLMLALLEVDFSGYDREEPHTLEQHHAFLEDIQKQVTKKQEKSKESESGVHYSALMDIQVIYEQIYPLKPSRSCQQQYIHTFY